MIQAAKNKIKSKKEREIFGKRGFTLVEILLYVSISGTILATFSFFLHTILSMQVKGQAISEVEQQGVQIMQIITQTAKDARGINLPARGNSDGSLSLDVIAPTDDPTIFDSSGGAIRITEGAGTPINLTSSRVTASDLIFSNLSRSGTPGTIHIEFTIVHLNPEGRNEYNYSKTFYGSASIR